jgi:hypothetical protein
MTLSTTTPSDLLESCTKMPNGARFYKCALQINPYDYLIRNNKKTIFSDEYNAAIVKTCKEEKIEVIGITDHYRVKESSQLAQAARAANIFVFNGFEAVTKDGVHFLCLFDPKFDNSLERYIGDCGIHNESDLSPLGNKDTQELLACAKYWPCACIAAHGAHANGGLLKKLSGKTRIDAWKSENLLACALPGPTEDAPEELKNILKNKYPQYHRKRNIAVIHATDVNCPENLKENGASCFIKMSEISVEALRQAFLDHESRIRLHTDPPPEPHTELIALSFEGGFLDDTKIHFNSNLNVLIGGRGAGKSTIIESLRYVLGLEPLERVS